MVKVEVIENFTLERFDELKNIVRSNAANSIHGKLFKGDVFECGEEMAKYLTGGNKLNKVVVKVIEVLPKGKPVGMLGNYNERNDHEAVIPLDEENLKEIAKQVNKAVKKSKKSKK